MPWDKDPDKAFPAPHPREPGGLRQDILDEIADHLACAAAVEREGEKSGNEETAWRRALERFGDPDAMARRLWWDQMKETIMREWIQTGVMIVAAAAVVVGVVFMGVMMARVGTANDAMEAAMQQVAASNEALMQGMAEQRRGNEALLQSLASRQVGGAEPAGTLELSTIDIVVRRGNEEGPPAPEVKVRMHGKGAGESTLSVDGELDANGRASFQRLYQGAYTFTFEDPQSQLFSEETITLFAGHGAGEYIIVAPDVTPRPIHVDWGLPEYARDDEQLIGAILHASWSHDGFEWQANIGVLMGHEETRAFSEAAAGLKTWHYAVNVFHDPVSRPDPNARQFPLSWEQYAPCALAGEVTIADEVVLLRRRADGEWRPSNTLDGQNSRRPSTVRPYRSETSVLTEVSDGYYTGTLPEEFFELYAGVARLARNRERIPDDIYADFMGVLATEMPEQVAVGALLPAEERVGVATERGVFGVPEPPRPRNMWKIGWEIESDFEGVFVLAWPDAGDLHHAAGRETYIALGGLNIRKARLAQDLPKPGDLRSRSMHNVVLVEELSGSALVAYAIRSPWREQEWPMYETDGTGEGAQLTTDPEPFWRMASDSIPSGNLYIPVSSLLSAPEQAPLTGILLRWEKKDIDDGWRWIADLSRIVDVDYPKGWSCWVTLAPLSDLAGGAGDQPLKDIDGRFHYDSIRSRAVELTPAEQ